MAKTEKYKKENAVLVLAKRMARNKNAMFGLILFAVLLIAILVVPLVSPYEFDKMDPLSINQGPSMEHLFGTDDLGRDIFTRVFYGGRYSLGISIASVMVSTIVGMVIGAIAGYFGGKHLVNTYGQTVEFADYREYQLGDDIRRIDWNLYRRFEKHFLKLFTDERQMQVQIFLDCSASMGKENPKKGAYAEAAAAAMGFLAVHNMDKVTFNLMKGER